MCSQPSTTIGPFTPNSRENSPAINLGSSSRSRCGSTRSAIRETAEVVELIQTFLRRWSSHAEDPSLPRRPVAAALQIEFARPGWSGIAERYMRQNVAVLFRLSATRQQRRGTGKKRQRGFLKRWTPPRTVNGEEKKSDTP